MRHTFPMSADGPLTRVPAPGTIVVHVRTRRQGRVTADAGYEGGLPVALVLWDGRPHEDVEYIRSLRLVSEAAAWGEPADVSEDD